MENVINNKENETIVEIEKPVLRTELPNDVIAYLRETYPPRTNGAGIKQKDTVDYITEERSFAESENINNCIMKYGLEPLGLLWFLRLQMAESLGWGIDVTGRKYNKLCGTLFCDNYISQERFVYLSNILIETGIIKGVDGSDGHTYWTTLQQFYNYEYKNWSKMKNSIASRKYQQSKKAQLKELEAIKSVTKNTDNSVDELNENDYFC